MTDPEDPQKPEDQPSTPPGDEEAARLLEVGLSDTGSATKAPPPSPAEMAPHFPAFEILEVLGQGGMGVVYKARQRKLDRLVALKVLPRDLAEDPAFAERFAREARTLARLQHPHIVGVYEFGESRGLYYLVMEYVDGVTLRKLMTTGELNWREALAIVPQICDALQYAHNEGVVHRDIKPENILLDKGGRVKVADFGLAKMTQRGPADFTLTGTDQVMGTVHYMAPEQYKTPQDVDHRADIFSLGVVFYEMLTGELPMGKFAKLSEVPELDARLDEIVMRALERERDLRYQEAEEVKTDVRTLVTGSEAPAEAASGHGHGERRRARHAARAERHGGRRWSRFVVWALVLLPVGAVVSGIVYAVNDTAIGEASARTEYHAAKAALWTGFGFAAASALLAAAGILMTRLHPTKVRGLVLGIICVIVGGNGMVATAIGVREEHRSYLRLQEYQRNSNRPRQSVPYVNVEGTHDARQQLAIRKGVLDTWGRYQRLVAVRDLETWHADQAKLYDRDDLNELIALGKADFDRKRAANELGMAFVGSASLETPLHRFVPYKIQVDEWQRNATVTARVQQPLRTGNRYVYPSITFFMKRSDDGWVFAVDKVRIEEYR